MKLAMAGITNEDLKFALQLGATEVVDGGSLPEDNGYYTVEDLRDLSEKVKKKGLKLSVLTALSDEYTYKIKLGLKGRDEQIENWCKTLRNIGEVGIRTLVYNFKLRSWYGNYGLRTNRAMPGRGGSVLTSFDYDDVRNDIEDYWGVPVPESIEVGDEQMWDNVTYFLKAVIPVAEEVGVQMALHPDDPPISPIGRVARIFRNHEALRRLIEIVPSDSNGLTFCTGTIGSMPEDILGAIRFFGTRGKIFHVHFRNVTGPVPKFSETFIGEGHIDMMEAMKVFHEVGVDVSMVEDHVPILEDGLIPAKQYRSRAYAYGYIRALLDAVKC